MTTTTQEVSDRAKYGIFMPEAVNFETVFPEGTDLEVVTYERNGKPNAVIFKGRSKKAKSHFYYQNKERRQEAIDKAIAFSIEETEEKRLAKEAKKNFQHSMKVGDFLSASWGYGQTNIEFYQVVALKGKKSVTVREVAQKITRSDRTADYVVAIKDEFVGDEMTKVVGQGNRIKITSFYGAHVWGGDARYQTNPYCGH